nr:fused MFS/spermidine synthase [Chloroflexota bacterium]
MRSKRFVLHLLVLIGGAATMGVEMCASRLLAPYFGNSLPVWGLLIALILAYLALGYFIGGRLADSHPQASLLYRLSVWAGFTIGLIPYLARPILHYSVIGFINYQAGAVLGSLLSVLALFAIPCILLGCIFPFAIRLSIDQALSSGNVAGRIYALSTMGSLLGTFSSVFWLIPTFGTRRTIFAISLSLLTTAIIGLFQTAGRRALLYILLLAFIVALQLLPQGAIKPTEGLIYEMDSAYNYIQVLQNGEEIVLKLNEGEGIQSVYHPQQILTGYVYDYFLLAPFFRSGQPSPPVSSLCLIGLAGGTTARQYSVVFGALPIDGVEIDPAIIETGQRFFGLNLPNLHIVVEDGRYYLTYSRKVYDVVIVDAYCPPYIPFQFTTVEFFQQVRDHLTTDGVVAINVAHTETDYTLVEAIASTLKAVYPNVYIVDTLSNLNSVVIASRQPSDLATIHTRLSSLNDPILSNVVSRAAGRIHEFFTPYALTLCDDHAPVEQIVHMSIVRYFLGQPSREVEW